MQPEHDLLQQGIAAFQAGDRETAHTLLARFVQDEPDNEQGWYYLAAVEKDPALRKRHLERVLALNPNNAKAREVLERIRARETAAEPAPAAEAPSPQPKPASQRPKIYALNPENKSPFGSLPPGEGVRPLRIPGAPEQITPAELVNDAAALVRAGWQVLLRRPGVHQFEVNAATWWRFCLVVVAGAVVSSAISLLLALFIVLRDGAPLFSVISVLLTPLLTIPITVGALFVGCYVSWRFAQSRGWNAPLVRHAMLAGIVWSPTVIFSSVLTFILSLLGFGGGLTGIFMLILAGYIMGEAYGDLYVISEPRDKFAIPAIALLTMLVVITVATIVLGAFIVGGAVPFALG